MKIVLDNVYDVYNHKLKTDGICGTITTMGNTSFIHCGTFLVIEYEDRQNNQGRYSSRGKSEEARS